MIPKVPSKSLSQTIQTSKPMFSCSSETLDQYIPVTPDESYMLELLEYPRTGSSHKNENE